MQRKSGRTCAVATPGRWIQTFFSYFIFHHPLSGLSVAAWATKIADQTDKICLLIRLCLLATISSPESPITDGAGHSFAVKIDKIEGILQRTTLPLSEARIGLLIPHSWCLDPLICQKLSRLILSHESLPLL